MHAPVKVRICIIALLLLKTFQTNSFPTPLSSAISDLQKDPKDYDKICQKYQGSDYVWDEGVQACVRCTSCDCQSMDPHCQKCRNFGILSCSTTVMTPTQPTTLPPTTPPLTATPTPTAAPTPTEAPTENTTSKAPSSLSTGAKVGYGVGASVSILILLLGAAGLWWCTRRRPKKEGPVIREETSKPAEKHPMIKHTDDVDLINGPASVENETPC